MTILLLALAWASIYVSGAIAGSGMFGSFSDNLLLYMVVFALLGVISGFLLSVWGSRRYGHR